MGTDELPAEIVDLLEEIDACLAKTGDSQDGLAFEVFRQRTHDELTAARPGIRDTPVTRMATPISESARAAVLPAAAEPRAGKTAKLIAAAAVIAGLGVALFQQVHVSDLRPAVNPSDEKRPETLARGEAD